MRSAVHLIIAAGLLTAAGALGACGKGDPAPPSPEEGAPAETSPDDAQGEAEGEGEGEAADQAAGDDGASPDPAAAAGDGDEALPPVPSLALNKPEMIGDGEGKRATGGVEALGGQAAKIDPAAATEIPAELRASREQCEAAADKLGEIMQAQALEMVPADADEAARKQILDMTQARMDAQRKEFATSCETQIPREIVSCFGEADSMQAWLGCAGQGMDEGDGSFTDDDAAAFEEAVDHQERILDLIEAHKDDPAAAGEALSSYVEEHGDDLKRLQQIGQSMQTKLQANPRQAMALLERLAPRMQAMSKRLQELGPALTALSENEEAREALDKLDLAR